MKVKVIKDDVLCRNPDFDKREKRRLGFRYKVHPHITLKNGTEIEDPNAWRMVLMGMAVPLDDEACEASEYDEETFQRASAAYDGLAAGKATGDPKHDNDPEPEEENEEEQEIEMVDDSQTVPAKPESKKTDSE